MKFEKFNLKKYLIGIGIFCALITTYYIFQKNKFKKIIENPQYTIGLVKSIEYGRSEDYYMYKYTIDGKDYQKGIGASSSNNLFIGTRYFVIFEKGKPKNAMLLPFMLIPENITEAPPEGWEELPVPADKEMIRHFLENY